MPHAGAGLFASGKFGHLKRDIPYATLAQALQSLTRLLLGKGDADLAPTRDLVVHSFRRRLVPAVR